METFAKLRKIVDTANASITSEYCSRVCKSYCCRHGRICFRPEKTELVTRGEKLETETIGEWVYLSVEGGCPNLSDNKCLIYPMRPEGCRNYPVSLNHEDQEEIVILIDRTCRAVQEGLLDEYFRQIRELDTVIK
ncbi:hypothetical protein GF386_00300 [Candidatus Pacearchaeota archaeon]|nr:hypothetical protein [Candidatus Pacearchaeota archaeon]MBD3282723.1 hypothetical protein [Candidatus Pacearchaeota archaeon]